MKNQTPLILCLVAGAILILIRWIGGLTFLFWLYGFLHSISELAPLFPFIDVVFLILGIIAFFGGWSIILGGFLLVTSHVRLGKIIIAIAAGFGLISLILAIIYVILVFGLAGLLLLTIFIVNTAWAFALLLTVIARSMAKN